MGIEEQLTVKTKFYNEAMRYMSNAKETLKKAQKDGRFFKDAKYVKTACGAAYNGVLTALDGYLLLKNVLTEKRRKSIEYYQANIAKLDKKLNVEVKNAYDILHLFGYYDGTTSVPVIKEGFDLAHAIIKRIQP
jgi:hypothetical protein